MTTIRKNISPEDLKALNERRFWSRVDTPRIFDRTKDCWWWLGPMLKNSNMPIFTVFDLTGKASTAYARRFAWNLEFPWLVLNHRQQLLHQCPNSEGNRCISPYHHFRKEQ